MSHPLYDCQTIDYTEFSGANLLMDEEDSTEPMALYNRNIMFSSGLFHTRNGFGDSGLPPASVRVLYNWAEQSYNRLVKLQQGELHSYDLIGKTDTLLLSGINASGLTFYQIGGSIEAAQFDTYGEPVGNVKVWNGDFSNGPPDVEDAFQAPLTTAQVQGGANWGTFTQPDPGIVTVGVHHYALVGTTKNGFQQPPGPLDGPPPLGTLVQASFTSNGTSDVHIVVNPATVWPAWCETFQIAMTAQGNEFRWYIVPDNFGGKFDFPGLGGTTIPLTFTINIDDGTLVQGTEITDTLFNLFTGNLFCHCLSTYGNRAVYIAKTAGPDGSEVATLIFSDPYKPQYFIPYLNQLFLPQYRDCRTGFELGGAFFALGPSWTYSWSDNLQSPVSWAPPRLVAGNIGSPYIRGVSVDQDRGVAWVADKGGLFCFNGMAYEILPASYYQTPDWERINFKADANSLVVKDVAQLRMVFVKAALDGAMNPTHILVWDYTNGVTPDRIKYCGLFSINQFPFIGDIETVINPTDNRVHELWATRLDQAGNILRMKSIAAGDAAEPDPTPLFDDDGQGIDSVYKILTVPTAKLGTQQQVGIRVRHRGGGQTNIKAYPFDLADDNDAIPMAPILASEASMNPGRRFVRYVDMQSPTATYGFDNGNIPGAFFYIAAIRSYYGPWMGE